LRLKNFFGHLRTINRHRFCVAVHCFRCGIGFQGLRHDLSKYSPTEFIAGVKYYEGYRSPNELEREETGYWAAWMHHKGRNRHHFEYWTDYNPVTHVMSPVKMPVRYVAEMFCDRVAAGKIYNGKKYTDAEPIKYFLRAKGRRVIHPETSDLLEMWLTDLNSKGEKITFAEVRQAVRNDRRQRRQQRKKASKPQS